MIIIVIITIILGKNSILILKLPGMQNPSSSIHMGHYSDFFELPVPVRLQIHLLKPGAFFY